MCLVLFVCFLRSLIALDSKKNVYSVKQDTMTMLKKVLNHFLKEVSPFPSPSISLTSIAEDTPLLRAASTLPSSYLHPLNTFSKLTSPAPFPSKFPALPQVGSEAKPFSNRRLFQFTHPQGKLVSHTSHILGPLAPSSTEQALPSLPNPCCLSASLSIPC